MVRAMTAFWPCRRFSAWSYTTERAPSITSSLTSTLRSAGSGCMKTASSLAVASRRASVIQSGYLAISFAPSASSVVVRSAPQLFA